MLTSIANVVDLSFSETPGVGDITFAMHTNTFSSEFGFYPSFNYSNVNETIKSVTSISFAGDVWLNNKADWTAGDFTAGGSGYGFILHQIGHSLGLKHPSETSASGGYILDASLISTQYTVMTFTQHPYSLYRTVDETSPGIYTPHYVNIQPETLMPLDIAALQYLYGANTSYHSGDDTYTFDTNRPFIKTIWDGGGNDTLSVANFSLGCVIDLRDGNFSSISIPSDPLPPGKIDSYSGIYDGTNNLAIANGTIIENAIGGSGDDQLIGNASDNKLDGGDGADTLTGGEGNDTLDGGAGNDIAVFSGAFTGYHLSYNAGIVTVNDTDPSNGNDGTDTLTAIETLRFADRDFTLVNGLPHNAPTLTKFAAVVAGGNQGSEIAVTFADLQAQGDEADIDGTVNAFVIKSISSGALKIGASAWTADGNNLVDATHQAYWTPAANAFGSLNAFTVVAKDDSGLESGAAIQATVAVADTTAPTVTISNNLPGTANRSTSSIAYTLAFSESITGLEANDFTTINGTVSSVTGSGSTWAVNVIPKQGVNTDTLSLTLNAGAVSDAAGNVNASAVNTSQIIDTSDPTVTSFSPTDEATGVNIGSNIVLSLSEPIQAGAGNFIIVNTNGTVAQTIAVTDSSQVSISGNTVTINPGADLAAGSGYYINTAAGVLKDLAGNSFAGISGTTAYNFTTVNNAPTLTAFGSNVSNGNEDSQITVNFADLQTQGKAVDVDGSVIAFVIKAVSSGALRIGASAATASAWNATTSNTVDATHQAYWTPAANANGSLNAFTAVAKDNAGAESASAIQAKVAVMAVNDQHTGTVTMQGATIAGQTLTASHTLADLDGLGAINYQWQASTDGSNWLAINGATADSLQLTRAQAGQFIRVHASYIDGGGVMESQDSAASNQVAPPRQVIFGAHGNDALAATTADDSINGGFGFDILRESGVLTDYAISQSGNSVVLTNNLTGERDVLTDIERVTFDSGNNLTIAYTEAEAVARHLMTHWLHRDLSVDEGAYVLQHLTTSSAAEIAKVFLTLPEASGLTNISPAELLAGYESHPLMQRLSAVREVMGGDGNDQNSLSFGVSVNIDSGKGHDVVTINETFANISVAANGNTLELSRHADGAMVDLKNVEMIALANGETIAIGHDRIEGILGRIVHTFFDRNASVEEWQLGRDALARHVAPDDILNWFQAHAGLTQLSDSDYIQTLFHNTFDRAATATEQNGYLTQLHNGSLDRSWLAVDLAQSQEAVTVIGSQVLVMDGWM